MRTLIYLLALLFIIACASCSSPSRRMAEERAGIESVSLVIVQYDTVNYRLVNDTIAIRRKDNAIFHKQQVWRGSAPRFYKAQ